MHISETRISRPSDIADGHRVVVMRHAIGCMNRFLFLRNEEAGRHTHAEEGQTLKTAFDLFPELQTLKENEFKEATGLCKDALNDLGTITFAMGDWIQFRERGRQVSRKRTRIAWQKFEKHLESLRRGFPLLAEAIRKAAFEPDPRSPVQTPEERPDPVRQAQHHGPHELRFLALRAIMASNRAADKTLDELMRNRERNRSTTSAIYEAKEAARRAVYEDAGVPYPGPAPEPRA